MGLTDNPSTREATATTATPVDPNLINVVQDAIRTIFNTHIYGSKELTLPIVYPDFVLGSGTVNNNGSKLGISVAVSSSCYVLLRLPPRARVLSVQLLLDNTPAADVDYAFYDGSVSLAAFSWSLLGSVMPDDSATPILTPTAPFAAGIQPDPGHVLAIKITTPGGAICEPSIAIVTYDTPPP